MSLLLLFSGGARTIRGSVSLESTLPNSASLAESAETAGLTSAITNSASVNTSADSASLEASPVNTSTLNASVP